MKKYQESDALVNLDEAPLVGSGGYIWNRWAQIFPSNFKKIDREHKVYASVVPMNLDREPPGWSIDFLADFRGRRYIIECDVNKSAVSVWHGFKVVGYRAAYCIDRVQNPQNIGMMMFINDRIFNHRVRNIFAVSGIEYCTFAEDGEAWKLCKASLW